MNHDLTTNSAHLTHEQLCDLLFDEPVQPPATNSLLGAFAAKATSTEAPVLAHLRSCEFCQEELAALQQTTSDFQLAMTDLASQLAQPSLRNSMLTAEPTWLQRTLHSFRPAPAFAAAFAAALLTVGLSVHYVTATKSAPQTPVARVAAKIAPARIQTAPNPATTLSDDALLEEIDQQVASPVPASMEPLATPSIAESLTSASQQRKN